MIIAFIGGIITATLIMITIFISIFIVVKMLEKIIKE